MAVPDLDPAAVLAFEKLTWKYVGAREARIRDEFGVSATAYFSRLREILADPASLALDPVTVRRLQRLAATRAALRSPTRLA